MTKVADPQGEVELSCYVKQSMNAFEFVQEHAAFTS